MEQKPEVDTDELNIIVNALISVLQSRNGLSLLEKLAEMDVDDIDTLNRFLDEWSVTDIKDVLDEIEERGDLLPKSELQEAITYLRNEWNAVVDIFNYGDTYLDNNMVERMNRYISLSRKNSLFFGSHKGAERGAILYTIALTCRMHKVNLFEYLTDVINRTAEWQPNTPIEKYRELLPDRWEKAND